jgi:cell division protein ZapE
MQRFADDLHSLTDQSLTILGREVKVKQRTDKVIWFEFDIICGRPRSHEDYLAIAKQYRVVLVSDVPDLTHVSADKVVSFINLVDILYDNHVSLILSAAVSIENLYPRGAFRKTFQRTESRLIEMQTKAYLQDSSSSNSRRSR